MKNFMKSIRITIVLCAFFCVFYMLLLWAFAKVASPNHGDVKMLTLNGKVVGAANIGQLFTSDLYFWGRPLCAGDKGYDATRSGGSNKSVTNKQYLAGVNKRINFFMKHHPYLRRKDVPAEMVTASGSGLDPDITIQSAYIQIRRVAKARGLKQAKVKAIVNSVIERPLLGLFGPAKINVLKLNIALDKDSKHE